MNTPKFIISILSLTWLLLPGTVNAQHKFDSKQIHLTVDWQMNAPFSTDFTDKISGWGANIELHYQWTPRWETGLFVSYHSNHDYVDRSTISLSPTETITTDQLRSAFQVPFGLSARYLMGNNKHLQPYAGAKLGVMFARNTTYYGTGGLYDKGYGAYVSPEIGLRFYPGADQRWGFHIAGYYSYATNKTTTLTHEIKGQNNAGFRLGLIF